MPSLCRYIKRGGAEKKNIVTLQHKKENKNKKIQLKRNYAIFHSDTSSISFFFFLSVYLRLSVRVLPLCSNQFHSVQ